MGRLTLNILLSFAQFEREMISERTRDKIGAARKKGKWIGGTPPLGYDIDKVKHKLVINEQEAKLIRKIYKLYLETSSILITTVTINEQGYTSKKYLSSTGRVTGGIKFDKNNIHRILLNPIYSGKVRYYGQLYDGEHEAIIDKELFEKVKDRIAYNRVNRKIQKNARCAGLLSQIIRCKACNARMIHTYTAKKVGPRYRYYVCLKAQKNGYATCPTRSVNAEATETTIIGLLPQVEVKNNKLLSDKYKATLEKILPAWDDLILNEKHRILTLLFKSIDYHGETGSLDMNLNEKGIYELYSEICLGEKA